MEVNEATLALVGTLIGTIGLELVRRWLSRSKEREDSASAMRTELRNEVYKLREELRLADTEIAKWRNDYFDLREQFVQLKANLEVALRMIKEQDERENEQEDRPNAERG